ncbi:initiation factor 2 [Daldinia caldariorum]|uniref:initiation factor 2 n=1 Tax=Daldinia caldariorum TaxID=326644 RepID=UPI0020081918|nr:initiation factor 2 [Daldinia caldariorum]KAI1463585.1 initiation factor 2 [Daldinia caldariorum]
MLRARISGRESSSICVFCRHRLSLRPATPRTEKHLSSTSILRDNDGWGGGWGSQAKPPAQQPKPEEFLSHHELLARQQLLAKQQAQKAQQAQQAPTPQLQPSGNGLGAKYIWNAPKQEEIEQSLQRNGMTFQKPPTAQREGGFRITKYGVDSKGVDIRPREGQGRPIEPVRRPSPMDPNNTGASTSTSSSSTSNLVPNFWTRPTSKSLGNLITKVAQGPRNNEPMPARAPIQESRPPSTEQRPSIEQSASTKQAVSTEQNQPPPAGPNPSATSTSPTTSPPKPVGDSGWGLLARKQSPSKSDGDDFWAAMAKSTGGLLRPKPKIPDTPEQGPKTPQEKKDPWAAMQNDITKKETTSATYDWGKEYDTLVPEKKAEERQRPEKEEPEKEEPEKEEPEKQEPEKKEPEKKPESAPEVSARQQAVTEGLQSRDRDPRREKRPDLIVQEERGRGGREKRSKRSSRRGNDEDEGDGFDYDAYQEKRRQKARRKAERQAQMAGHVPILLPELITIPALAEALKVEPNLFLTQLGEMGFEGVTLDSLMAGETAALVVQEYGFEPTVESGEDRDLKPRPPPKDPSVLPPRPPVVTIMGHVDHGKTTLLDYLRKSSIAAQEHGGITQRIGAFSVKLSSGKPITFLDTPGHAAFLSMRQRGAYVTDIVVLVVAADDSVMPQTIEAIKHARAAKVPMIVAINKVDKDGANINQVKNDLAREGVEIEDFGGDVQVVCVSGKTGQGMDDLEENILLLSEILDHRAEVDGPAEGWILESSLKPLGKAATVLVKRGTLRLGDFIAAGVTWAKIRHMRNEAGLDINEAPPGTPVEILGWKDLPAAGDQVLQAPDEGSAKEAVEYRERLREMEKDAVAQAAITEARKAQQEKRAREKAAESAGEEIEEALPEKENGAKMVNFVVKGDLHGSVEAVCAAIQELGNHEVQPRILRSGTGPIREFDVEHAAASNSIIVNFATTTPGYIEQMAEEKGVKILDHKVIYHVIDDVKSILSDYLEPEVTSHVLGEAEVLQIFPINIKGRMYKNIAGCRVRQGLLTKTNLFRIIRNGEKVYDGKLETLKHLKKDVTEVKTGTECGVGFEHFQDFEVGDKIQAYKQIITERTL